MTDAERAARLFDMTAQPEISQHAATNMQQTLRLLLVEIEKNEAEIGEKLWAGNLVRDALAVTQS